MVSLAMPIITNQPSTSGMPVVSPASQSRASFGDGNPPQWTGPQVVPPTAQGAGATGQSAVIGPIEPEPWRPGR